MVLELALRTMAHDAHSSLSVVLPNAAHRLVAALATFWDADGRPAIDGLDAGKRAPRTTSWRPSGRWTSRPSTTSARTSRSTGSSAGWTATRPLEALTFQTTLNVQGLWSGHTESTPKTVTPAEAHARLDIRIVPDQVPADDRRGRPAPPRRPRVRRRRDRPPRGRAGVVDAAEPPGRADRRARLGGGRRASRRASACRWPGTVPMHQVCARNRVPATMLGAGRADCRACTPRREHPDRATSSLATRMMGRFVDAFARLPEVPKVP